MRYKPLLMRFLRTFSTGILAALLLASCASERKVTYSRGGGEEFGSKYMSDVQFETQKDGSVKPNKDVRSQYDGKSEYLSARDFSGKDYTTAKYNKKRWGKDLSYANKQYAGATDGSKFEYSPQFVQQQAKAQGQVAQVGDKQYGAAQYNAGQANVAKRDTYLDRPSDAETNVRRRVYKQPDIITKQDYTELSIEESRNLLGRGSKN